MAVDKSSKSSAWLCVLVCYDIADDRRRSAVANLLLPHGPRVQLSTYECRFSDQKGLDRLINAIQQTIDKHLDQVRMYRLSGNLHKPTILGNRELQEWVDYWIL